MLLTHVRITNILPESLSKRKIRKLASNIGFFKRIFSN